MRTTRTAVLRHGMRAYEYLLSVLLPEACIICKTENTLFCDTCSAAIPLVLHTQCAFCGKLSANGATCTYCARHTPLAGAVSFVSYAEPAIQTLLHAWKYTPIESLGAPCAHLLTRALAHNATHPIHSLSAPLYVCSIPLHQKKIKQRGFNQSDALARAVANALPHATYNSSLLIRTKNTASQASLETLDRFHNTINAFSVAEKAKPLVRNARIIIVDDVITSANTAHAAAQALIEAGAQSVWAVTLAYGHAGR